MISLRYAKPFGGRVRFGVGAKSYRMEIDDKRATGILGDAGMQVDLWKDVLAAGVSASNFGGDVRFVSKSDNAPLTGSAGLAYTPWGNNLTLAADASVPRDDTVRFKTGAEWWANKTIALRAGYDSSYEALLGVSAGIGIAIHNFEVSFFPIDRIMIDYAFTPTKDYNHIHQVGISGLESMRCNRSAG